MCASSGGNGHCSSCMSLPVGGFVVVFRTGFDSGARSVNMTL
jgi:hypothetical protein